MNSCTWCGSPLGRHQLPSCSAGVFCSWHCQSEGYFWLYKQLSIIQITHLPPSPGDRFDRP